MDRNQNGFTLIEVLVTLAILSIGLLGMAALTIEVIRSNAQSRAYAEATILAQDKLEEIKRIGYGYNRSDPEVIGRFTRQPFPSAENNPEDGMKEVAVRVSWNSIGGRSHSIELKTLLAAE